MKKTQVLLAFLWLLSAAAILIRVSSLRFNPPESPFLFWLPYAALIILSALIVLIRKDTGGLLIVLGMSLVLHLINSVRQPESFVLAVDSASNFQVGTRLIETGHLATGYDGFTSVAFAGSFHPGLELLLCSSNLISGIPLLELYKWAMVGINVITILSFFFILRRIGIDLRIVNFAIFLYALCPMFHGFDSYAMHESLALIFYPILMSIFLTDPQNARARIFHSRSFAITIFVFASLLAVTHHFTMYMLIFQSVLILAGFYILRRKVSLTQVKMLLLLTIILVSWLLYNASYLLETHGRFATEIVQSIFLEKSAPTETVPQSYSMPLLERSFVYGGVGLLLLTSLVGLFRILRTKTEELIHRIDKTFLVLWWSINVAILSVFVIIPWSTLGPGESAVQFRDTEFVYFGIVLFSAVGIQTMFSPEGNVHWSRNKPKMKYLRWIVALFIVLIIAIPTILIGFKYYVYDNPPPKVSDNLYPIESHLSLVWLSTFSTSKSVIGNRGARSDILGEASRVWKFSLFRESLKTRDVLEGIYWVHRANLLYPDATDFRLEADDESWLDSNLNRIYDNAGVMILSPRNFNP